ncbi:MAG: OmpA family protein [Prevotellaceae bacterium]|jgi:outer membrane protein OmpA-like peptidoglycan-associated protein|nr:OmpA family protein [Prevotellaceae bacterium]
MKKTFLLILSVLLGVSAFAHDELTKKDYKHWSIMLKGGVMRNGYQSVSENAIRATDEKEFTFGYGAEIERTFNHIWGAAVSAQFYDYYGSFGAYIPTVTKPYNIFVSGQAIETALLGAVNLSNLFAEDRSEGWRKFNVYFRAGAGVTFYSTDQKEVMKKFTENPGDTDKDANYKKDYKKKTIVIPTELQFEYNFCKPLALGLIIGHRWHTSTHFGMPNIPKRIDTGGNVSTENAVGKNITFYNAQLSLRYKINSTRSRKHIRNYVPELKEEILLVKAFDDVPIIARLDFIEGRLGDVERALRDHDLMFQKLAEKQVDFKEPGLIIIPVVEFDTDKSVIKNNFSADLDVLATALAEEPTDFTILVGGHTDSTASDAYNDRLSQERANAVKAYLESRGVRQPIVATGYGEKSPIAPNDTPEGRQHNRRVEIRFTTTPQ